MTAARADLPTTVAGNTVKLSFQVKNQDGTNRPLGSGVQLRFLAKRSVSDPDTEAVVDLDSQAGGGITVDPDQTTNPGLASLEIQPEDTATFTRKLNLAYALKVYESGNDDYVFLYGSWPIVPSAIQSGVAP
jgi:hypothetical protein